MKRLRDGIGELEKMNKRIMKIINELAISITGYDICDIESFETPDEAIESHLDWLEGHFTDIRQNFENEVRKYRK